MAKKESAIGKAAFIAGKALAIADAWKNIHLANVKAVNMSFATAGQPWVGINTAIGIAEIAGIAAQSAEEMKQFAKGKYTVRGMDDGRLYNAPYIGTVDNTGIVKGPAIISERGDEMIITGPHVRNMQANFPEIIQAINHTRVPQHAAGSYVQTPSMIPSGSTSSTTMSSINNDVFQEISNSINRLNQTTERLSSKLDNLYAKVILDEITKAQNEVTAIENDVKYL
jgi:hypothetical protein